MNELSAMNIHRSFSAPDTGQLHNGQGGSGGSGEKKRNKLGYNRTSVACTNCRKRKIRCVPSEDDAKGRCGHCSRLNKECSFNPTEQQQGSDPRPRASAQSPLELRNDSSASPPAMNAAETLPPHFPPLATNAPQISSPPMRAPAGAMGILPSNGSPAFDLHQNPSNWPPPNMNYFDGSSASWTDPWRPRQDLDSPMSEHGPEPPLSATWTGLPNMGSRNNFPWGPPLPAQNRSMSYSGESLSGPSPAQYAMMSPNGVVERQGAPWGLSSPVPVAGRGEVYQPGINNIENPIPPLGVANPPNMQWQQQHHNFHGAQDPFGSWMHGGTAASQLQPSASGHGIPPDDPTEPAGGGSQ